MKKLISITIFTGILTLLGCGQSGPLYLPEDESVSSGSTMATSGSSMASGSTQKVDSDPSSSKNSDLQAAELTDKSKM